MWSQHLSVESYALKKNKKKGHTLILIPDQMKKEIIGSGISHILNLLILINFRNCITILSSLGGLSMFVTMKFKLKIWSTCVWKALVKIKFLLCRSIFLVQLHISPLQKIFSICFYYFSIQWDLVKFLLSECTNAFINKSFKLTFKALSKSLVTQLIDIFWCFYKKYSGFKSLTLNYWIIKNKKK